MGCWHKLPQFKFYNDEDDRAALTDEESDLIPIEITREHMDPFFSECRAYGRLNEEGLNGEVAVRCYGFVTIPAEHEDEMKQNFDVHEWNRPRSEYKKVPHRRQPLRAIVKDLVTEDVPLTKLVADKILKDLKTMHKVGVYTMDVQKRNYKNGLLLDFSVSITTPHYLFVIKPRWRVRVYKRADLVSWQRMVSEEGVKTQVRAVRNSQYCRKLRSYKG